VGDVIYEAVEFIEEEYHGVPAGIPTERLLGTFSTDAEAIAAGRAARDEYDRDDYAWWVVRREGERIALWIADSRSGREFMLDLTSNELVELP